MFGKKKHDEKQRALRWYYVENRQMLTRLSDISIPPGQYAVVITDTHPWGASAPDKITVVSTYVEALKLLREQNDWARQHDISSPDVQVVILDSHKQIVCWVHSGPDAQPIVPDLDAVFGAKPDDAVMLDEVMKKERESQQSPGGDSLKAAPQE